MSIFKIINHGSKFVLKMIIVQLKIFGLTLFHIRLLAALYWGVFQVLVHYLAAPNKSLKFDARKARAS